MKTIIPFLSFLFVLNLSFGQTETDQQKSMAKQMASWMDQAWKTQPESGYGNLRILTTKDGNPYAGNVSIYGEFSFVAKQGNKQVTTSFNPNSNGRWVNEEMDPGTYTITIKGTKQFPDFTFETTVEIKAGETPVVKMEL